MTFILSLLIAILPACPSEDANMCYWDASQQGNGTGLSFIALNSKVIYID